MKKIIELIKTELQQNKLFLNIVIDALESKNAGLKDRYFIDILHLENYYNDYLDFNSLLCDVNNEITKNDLEYDITLENILNILDLLIEEEK